MNTVVQGDKISVPQMEFRFLACNRNQLLAILQIAQLLQYHNKILPRKSPLDINRRTQAVGSKMFSSKFIT